MTEKLTIKNLLTKEEIICIFNPKEYTLTKQNQWDTAIKQGQNVPQSTFKGGGAAQYQVPIALLIPVSSIHTKVASQPAMSMYEPIRGACGDSCRLIPNRRTSRPALADRRIATSCGVQQNSDFDAIVESLSEKYILFNRQGIPIRSVVDISFKTVV